MTTWTSHIRGRRVPVFLALLALAMLGPGTGTLPLQDRDEPRFAQAAREMMERRDWIVPTFNGDYRFDKPPLIYWMMMAFYAAGGVNEWTARAPSVVCAFLLAWLIWTAGARWFGHPTGLLAAVMALTHFQMAQHGRGAVADMPMILSVLAAQIALFEKLAERPDRPAFRGWFWVLYFAIGIGFLAKGPVAFLIPLLTVPVYWLFAGRPRLALMRLRPFLGACLALALIGAWGIPALMETDGEFARIGLGKHVLERGMEAFEGHGAPFFFYLLSSPVSLFPWSLFIPSAIVLAIRQRDPTVRFLAAWIVVTFVLFSLYATKLPHYVMPCYPAFFLLAARAIDLGVDPGRSAKVWSAVLFTIVGIAAVVLAIAAAAAWKAGPWPAGGMALLGASLLFVGLALIPRAVFRPGWGSVALAAMLTCAGTEALARGLREINPTLRAMPALASLPPDTRCAFSSFREPSVVFYTNRRWQTVDEGEELRRFAEGPGPRALLVRLHEQRLKPSGSRPPDPEREAWFLSLTNLGYEISRTDGWNAARSSRVILGVAVRRGEGERRVE